MGWTASSTTPVLAELRWMVRQRDASPAATEGLAAVAVGTEQIRLSSLLLGGGTSVGKSGTAKHHSSLAVLRDWRVGEREEEVDRSRGFGLAVAPSVHPCHQISLDGGLDGGSPVVIGPVESQWLDGTGSSVSDTIGQKLGGEGGGLRDDDLRWHELGLGINWTE